MSSIHDRICTGRSEVGLSSPPTEINILPIVGKTGNWQRTLPIGDNGPMGAEYQWEALYKGIFCYSGQPISRESQGLGRDWLWQSNRTPFTISFQIFFSNSWAIVFFWKDLLKKIPLWFRVTCSANRCPHISLHWAVNTVQYSVYQWACRDNSALVRQTSNWQTGTVTGRPAQLLSDRHSYCQTGTVTVRPAQLLSDRYSNWHTGMCCVHIMYIYIVFETDYYWPTLTTRILRYSDEVRRSISSGHCTNVRCWCKIRRFEANVLIFSFQNGP